MVAAWVGVELESRPVGLVSASDEECSDGRLGGHDLHKLTCCLWVG